MPAEDGLAHINSHSHIARLTQFNASTLTFRIREFTLLCSSVSKKSTSVLPIAHIKDQQCEITNDVPMSAEIFTHITSSRYLVFAIPLTLPRTIEPTQTKPKIWNTVAISASLSAVLWTCTICNREMPDISKIDHLVEKSHARMLIFKSSTDPISPHVNFSTSGTSKANKIKKKRNAKPNLLNNHLLQNWTCQFCNVVVILQQKASHFCFNSDSKSLINDDPLDKFFNFYRSFHYDVFTFFVISFEFLQNHLQKRHKWFHDNPESKDLWRCYQVALTQKFNLWFDVEDDLNAWYSLCRALRITPLPTTCKLCRSIGLTSFIFQILTWTLILETSRSRPSCQHHRSHRVGAHWWQTRSNFPDSEDFEWLQFWKPEDI